ncbi:hypothetical protein SDC9_156083 [bioreactor metagenome]|uniref:Uncharacterized protein n=1 Tax=bioreactor metagenome TaxID=1076179 RepID=A0A645F398_9ZZZZ
MRQHPTRQQGGVHHRAEEDGGIQNPLHEIIRFAALYGGDRRARAGFVAAILRLEDRKARLVRLELCEQPAYLGRFAIEPRGADALVPCRNQRFEHLFVVCGGDRDAKRQPRRLLDKFIQGMLHTMVSFLTE